MRRNMGRNRGNMGGPGAGPLMTGHLQDLDMELELLKRKREMIEQQQQLLVMEQQFQSSRHYDTYDRFDEPNQHGSNRDYTHLYDSGPKHRNQFGRKRQADVQWQYEGSPKRTHPKRKSNPSQFVHQGQGQQGPGNAGPANIRNQRPMSDSRGKGPTPLMGVKVKPFVGQKIANQKPTSKPGQKGFAPTKVFKPKASTAPNKVASQLSAAERKSLVSAAKDSVAESDVTRMLLPDRVPTQQVSGRLELALGAIMKNIRDIVGNDSPNASILRSMQLQRVMKQAVRERIRTVMLGKVVGSLLEILAIYREEFPQETDIDIVNIALEAAGVPTNQQEEKTRFIKSEDPEDFFKRNMNCLVETHLDEMFSKLEELYNGEPPIAKELPENQMELDKPNKKADENEQIDPKDSNNEQDDSKDGKNEQDDSKDGINEQVDDPKDGSHEQIDDPKDGENEQVDPKDGKNKQIDPKDGKNFLDMDIKPRDVKRILPRLLKKYIPYIVKLLNIDAMYQSTKTAITMKANQLALKKVIIKKEIMVVPEKIVASPANGTPRHSYNLPYYVKIMGRPSLPKKKVMQAFLSQFNPKSIKKHRTIHNLLFVGFSEKTDYDVMVAADGTVVGRSTLSIRVCTNKVNESVTEQNGEKSETDFTMDVSQGDVEKGDEKADGDIISAELDGQITDLLSSIRKSEEGQEEPADNTEENGKPPVGNSEEGKPPVDNTSEKNTDAVTVQDENKPTEMTTDQETDQKYREDDENDWAEDNQDDTAKTTENVLDKIDAIVKASEGIPDETGSEEKGNLNGTENAADSGNTGDQGENDKVEELKDNANASGRATPSRTSARLASVTPSTIRTRRASRLTQN